MPPTIAITNPIDNLHILVSVPSTPKAYMTLAEGKQHSSAKDYSKINILVTEIICTHTGVCPLC